MKKAIFFFALILGAMTQMFAQTPATTGKKAGVKMEQKEHVCTDACRAAGHCVFAHGEKGHKCTDACKTAAAPASMELKEHVCTSACKNGSHVYAHGEKGHTCTSACMKKM